MACRRAAFLLLLVVSAQVSIAVRGEDDDEVVMWTETQGPFEAFEELVALFDQVAETEAADDEQKKQATHNLQILEDSAREQHDFNVANSIAPFIVKGRILVKAMDGIKGVVITSKWVKAKIQWDKLLLFQALAELNPIFDKIGNTFGGRFSMTKAAKAANARNTWNEKGNAAKVKIVENMAEKFGAAWQANRGRVTSNDVALLARVLQVVGGMSSVFQSGVAKKADWVKEKDAWVKAKKQWDLFYSSMRSEYY